MPPHSEDHRRRLLQRHPDNPILSAHDWPYFVNSVFNAGAVRMPSGETLLLCRVEDPVRCDVEQELHRVEFAAHETSPARRQCFTKMSSNCLDASFKAGFRNARLLFSCFAP